MEIRTDAPDWVKKMNPSWIEEAEACEELLLELSSIWKLIGDPESFFTGLTFWNDGNPMLTLSKGKSMIRIVHGETESFKEAENSTKDAKRFIWTMPADQYEEVCEVTLMYESIEKYITLLVGRRVKKVQEAKGIRQG